MRIEADQHREEEILARLDREEKMCELEIDKLNAQVLKLEGDVDSAKFVLARLRKEDQLREEDMNKVTEAQKAIKAHIKSIRGLQVKAL